MSKNNKYAQCLKTFSLIFYNYIKKTEMFSFNNERESKIK